MVVVDLKTGKYLPTGPAVLTHPQLGLYQLAVDHGAADEIAGGPVRSGGAELVQLRVGDAMPKVQAQPPGARGRGPAAGRGAADGRRGDGPRRGVRGPARASTASAARSRRSAPTRPPGRCCRDPHPATPPSSSPRCSARTWTFSPQQWAAVTAPLEPAVVIAGAGSGKTTVMAARVVWLVATGRVAPGEILGLTFTTKATAELQTRIRENLRKAGLLPERATRVGDDEEEVEEPTVATYHSYASALLSEHGLRIGHEPDTRLIADASRYQLATRAVQRYTSPVDQLTDSPRHVVQYLLALDAEMSEHLVDPATVRAYDASERPRFVDGMADRAPQDLPREEREGDRGDRQAGRAARPGRGLPRAQGAPRPDGLLRPDRARRAARGDASRGRRGRARQVQGGPPRRVPGHLGRPGADAAAGCSPARTPSTASATRSPRSATPTRRSTAGGAPRSPTSSSSRRASRPATAAPRRTPSPSTGAPTSGSWPPPTTSPPSSTPADPSCCRWRPKPGAATGEVTAVVHETYDDELAWLADRVIATHAEMAEPAWREIGVLTRDNSHAAAVFDALSDREIPVEIVGLKGLLRLPEVSEVVATLTLVQDVTANAALLTLLAGPRWAIGPRDLALLGRRARELAGSQQGGESFADVEAQLRAAVEGADPTEIASLCDALEDPGDLAYSPEALGRFAAAGRRAAPAARGDRRADPRPGPPDHRRDRHRRRAGLVGQPGRRGPARQPRPVRAGGRRVPGRRRPGHPGRAAGLAGGRGRVRPGPRRGHPVRGRLGQAAHRPPRQGPRVGRGVPGRRHRAQVPHQPQPVQLADRAVRDARRAPRRRPRPADAGRPHPRRHRRAGQGRQGARGGRGAPARATSRGPAPGTGSPCPRGAGPATSRPASAPRRTSSPPGRRWPPGAGSPTPGSTCRRRARSAPTPPPRPTSPGRSRTAPPRWTAGSPPPSWSARPARTSPTSSRTCCCSTRSSSGTTRSSGCSRRPAATGRPRSRCRCRPACPRPSLARLRDDPEEFARDLARPMPRQPSPAARFGTRFHAWVEARFGQQLLLDPDELPGRADSGVDDESDLRELVKAFENGAFADRVPHAVEPPFALVLAGQVVRGRIDAVYARGRRVVPAGRLEDQPHRVRRPAPARDLPHRLGRAAPACRSSGCGRRSTTSAPAGWSSTTGCRSGPSWSGCWGSEPSGLLGDEGDHLAQRGDVALQRPASLAGSPSPRSCAARRGCPCGSGRSPRRRAR